MSLIMYCIFLLCIDSPINNGVLRLFHNGITSSLNHFGIVQIQYNGQWGNICDDDDDYGQDEGVICHQLGYTGASSYSRALCLVMVMTLT